MEGMFQFLTLLNPVKEAAYQRAPTRFREDLRCRLHLRHGFLHFLNGCRLRLFHLKAESGLNKGILVFSDATLHRTQIEYQDARLEKILGPSGSPLKSEAEIVAAHGAAKLKYPPGTPLKEFLKVPPRNEEVVGGETPKSRS